MPPDGSLRNEPAIAVANTEPCRVLVAGKQTTQQVSVQSTFGGRALIVSMSNTMLNRRSASKDISSVPPGLLASQMVITLGGALVLSGRFAVPPTVGDPGAEFTMSMTFGEAYQGIRHVNYVVQKGFLTGAIDGRAIVPQHAGLAPKPSPTGILSPPLPPVFQDHQPPPKVIVNSALVAAIKALLLNDLPQAVAQCHKIASPSGDTQACQACTNNCGEQGLVCIAAATAGCVASLGWGCVAIPACYAAIGLCDFNCNEVGAACCQEQCPGGVCCQSNDVCCGGTCCPEDSICSGGVCCTAAQPIGCGAGTSAETCCAQGQVCADPNSGLCCKNGLVACGDTCCSSSSNCINGTICCDGGIVCNGTSCCRDGSQCNTQTGQCGFNPCGNDFCVFQECCNGVCCQFNQTCVNGVCTSATCPSGTVLCQFTPGQCCPPNFICCTEGKCCDPSTQICCGGSEACIPASSGGCGF